MNKATEGRRETRLEILLLTLVGVVILLMVAIIGLFLRVNQMQKEVLTVAAPLKMVVEAQVDMAERMLQMDTEQELAVGSQAPPFTLNDVSGTSVSLQDFAGERVLLGFSSTDCEACSEMYPGLAEYAQSHSEVRVLLVSMGSAEDTIEIAQTYDLSFPVLPVSGQNKDVFAAYMISRVPFFYVVSEDGVVSNAGVAQLPEQMDALVADSGE